MVAPAGTYVYFGHYCRSRGVFRRNVVRLVRIEMVAKGPESKNVEAKTLLEY